jgi:uncharacterized protein YutE (UPF0331/DUF86 family)
VDSRVVAQKLESLRRCLQRVEEKCPEDAAGLARDLDAQDIVALNLTRAVQLCVDIGAHLLAARDTAAPGTMGEVFDVLAREQLVPDDVAQRLKKAVGFRNIAVHNYEVIDWEIVFSICRVSADQIARLSAAHLSRSVWGGFRTHARAGKWIWLGLG